MKTIQQGSSTYEIGRMNPRAQFHVTRRLAPILAGLVPLAAVLKQQEVGAEPPMDLLMTSAIPLANGLAEMPDAEADYIIDACLSVVRRVQSGGSAPVLAPDGHTIMFDDLSMQDIIKLTVAVVQENMGNFFDLLPIG